MKCYAFFLLAITAVAYAHDNTLSLEAHEVGTGDARISALAPSSSPAPVEQIITLTRPVEVRIAYGKTKLPAG
jgi:hypothetical protein